MAPLVKAVCFAVRRSSFADRGRANHLLVAEAEFSSDLSSNHSMSRCPSWLRFGTAMLPHKKKQCYRTNLILPPFL
jgi:hypothetical protein